jgi:hypothetical protein
MYFRESDTLLRDNPEYEIYIKKIDAFLGALKSEERNQLDICVVADFTGVDDNIVEFIFEYYCKAKVLAKNKYIICPIQMDIIKDVRTSKSGEFIEFCDICGEELIFTERDIVNRYSLLSSAEPTKIPGEIKPSDKQSAKVSNGSSAASGTDSKTLPEGDISYPKIKISPKNKEIARIAAIQLNFELSVDRFPPEIVDKETVRRKIGSALSVAKEYKADIVCFPELCICDEWLPEIKSQSADMIVIAGSYYDEERHNTCQILYNSTTANDIDPQIKIKPSEFESPQETGTGMVSGDKIYIYESNVGFFSVLICRDFGNYIKNLADDIDIIFVPSYNLTTSNSVTITN